MDNNGKQLDIACVITSYKNIEMALFAADSLCKQNYDNFHIYLIADSFFLKGVDDCDKCIFRGQ